MGCGVPLLDYQVVFFKRHHCQIAGGALAGLQAMVSEANNAPVHVFSPKYLEKDAALKTKLTTEGM